jgi:ABC-2 type transport system ATP-binding protein
VLLRTHENERALAALQAAGFNPQAVENGTLALEQAWAVQQPEEIASLLVKAGAPPTHLVVEQEDLEDYFLRLVGMNGAQP